MTRVDLAQFSDFDPGPLYRKKAYLGAGAWKVAFKATSPGSLIDVALLCYHGSDSKGIADDAAKLLRLVGSHQNAKHITRVHNIFVDEINRVWIVEELLHKSLSRLAPLSDSRKFCGIARDLCRGLQYIHSKNLVHRDLKLDNCGVDDRGAAKIFDVGSVTSEPGKSVCTILTRPPELLSPPSGGTRRSIRFRKAGDIWALGATLFALRTGRYPFVSEAEIREREALGMLLATRQIDRKEYGVRKALLDERVAARAGSSDAARTLTGKVSKSFDGGARRILLEMLEFDPDLRKGADYFVREWTGLADNYTKPVRQSGEPDHARAIQDFLRAVEKGALTASPLHIEKCRKKWAAIHEGVSVAKRDARTEALLLRVEKKVEEQWKDRLAPRS